MNYLPPGHVQRVGDERFPRWIVRDARRQYLRQDHWSDKPGEAVLFGSEADAMNARNRYGLGDEADTFTVAAVVTVHARRGRCRYSHVF